MVKKTPTPKRKPAAKATQYSATRTERTPSTSVGRRAAVANKRNMKKK
jgi:hypothetical protein